MLLNMSGMLWLKPALMAATLGVIGFLLVQQVYVPAPDVGKLGGPIEGLTPEQLRKFYKTKEVFKHEFTIQEGLGPLFNGRSCFECHGQPGIAGGEGRDVTSTGVVRVASRLPYSPKAKKPLKEVITDLQRADVTLYPDRGGPAIQRKSITSEFPNLFPMDCQIEIGTIPPGAECVSLRHAGPVFGFGLIEAIPDGSIANNIFEQLRVAPELAGRAVRHVDPLTDRSRIGRFGWKDQMSTLPDFTIEALNTEMGISTFANRTERSATGRSVFPLCVRRLLPEGPNDKGDITAKLAYFQALLAPPPRGEVTEKVKRGENLFKKLQCAVCHVPVMYTAPIVYLIDPDSPAPKYNHIEVEALESKPVRAYSDFLLHNMGVELADGVPQLGAKGGEWRTTPLWGLRFKKFYLHDGRTRDLTQAIMLHGGQASKVRDNFARLPEKEKEDLLAFLKSL
ncbi:MAG TPA: di-heme oxidoredictase family protein [Candidatus Obscuribacterales bacterium]